MCAYSPVYVLTTAIALCFSPVATQIRGQGLADLLEKDDSEGSAKPIAKAAPGTSDTAVETAAEREGTVGITAQARRDAAARVREVFAKQVSQAKTPAQKAAVAKQMIRLVPEATEPAEAYVLLETAISLSVDGQDPITMDEAITLLTRMFDVDLQSQRRDALITMCKKAPLDSLAAVVDALVAEGSRLAKAGRTDVAKEATKAAATAARRLRDPARQKKIAELLQQITEQEKAHAAIQPLLDRLAKNPRDGQALLELGKYRCFEEGNWTDGLKFLAECPEPVLAKAARLDLAVDGSPAAHREVADLWFALHEKESIKAANGPLERAKFHYERAMGAATGLARAQILKRLDEIAKSEGGADNWIIVFRSDDPSIWNTKTEEGFLRFATPLEALPPTVRYVRIRRPNGDAVILPIKKQQLGEDAFGPRYGWRGAGSTVANDLVLGISDERQKIGQAETGKVIIGYKPDRSMTTGWGFGHKHNHRTQTSMAWNGQTVQPEPLEISVLARELTPRERRQSNLLE